MSNIVDIFNIWILIKNIKELHNIIKLFIVFLNIYFSYMRVKYLKSNQSYYDWQLMVSQRNKRKNDSFEECKRISNPVRVFPDAFENYWKFFTFDPPKYQLDSLSYQKQVSLCKIEATLLLQNVVTGTKKK
ncbi:Reverse transcriptase domain-containing protein [Aphis craccivora]|uniref:Reverse transcriptase domain-containing protein n=1 Tax=Aphis craccivora TaxID=307492 RepID=A0A6G0ZLD7_APHCR|nr:Reverse transcriptase domain-containing protein [Aphis craccivora]